MRSFVIINYIFAKKIKICINSICLCSMQLKHLLTVLALGCDEAPSLPTNKLKAGIFYNTCDNKLNESIDPLSINYFLDET